jgi:hypothetical protein
MKMMTVRIPTTGLLAVFALICMLCGAVLTIATLGYLEGERLKAKSIQLEKDVNRAADVVHQYINDRAIIMKQFADMEARFTRMEHMMHIPRAERHGAWKAMVEDQ